MNKNAEHFGVLSMWVIFIKPIDYPGKVVVRRFEFETPTSDVQVFDYVGQARRWIRDNTVACVPIPRDRNDDPHILETWL